MHIQADSINNYCQFTFQNNPNQCKKRKKNKYTSKQQTDIVIVSDGIFVSYWGI